MPKKNWGSLVLDEASEGPGGVSGRRECQPGRRSRFDQSTEGTRVCLPKLQECVRCVQCKVYGALGAFATLDVFLGDGGRSGVDSRYRIRPLTAFNAFLAACSNRGNSFLREFFVLEARKALGDVAGSGPCGIDELIAKLEVSRDL